MAAPYGECARCGFKRRVNELAQEWSGHRVCRDTCWDPRPAEHRAPGYRPEGLPVPNAAPATEPIFREDVAGDFDEADFESAEFETAPGL